MPSRPPPSPPQPDSPDASVPPPRPRPASQESEGRDAARARSRRKSPQAAAPCVQGTIERVTFHSADSLYSVLRIQPERGFGDPESSVSILGERLSAVGPATDPTEGLRVRLTGTWSVHGTHGRQFRFERLEVLPPLDRAGLERYLASPVFRGIGPKLAERIVDVLGANCLTLIRNEPQRLAAVPGLRRAVATELAEAVQRELGSQELFAFLLGIGLGPWQVDAVVKKYGPDAEASLRKNPYLLAQGIDGIGFQTADRVARNLGLDENAPERRAAAAWHALKRAGSEGHCLVPQPELLERVRELLKLEIAPEDFAADLATLAARRDIVLETLPPAPDAPAGEDEVGSRTLVYLAWLHTSECGLAENLLALRDVGPVRALAEEDDLHEAEARAQLDLHPDQREAVLGLLRHPVSILTGGPGVGKTTIVRLVVGLAQSAGARVLLASPTGRAAKRLAEASGHEARTVHRLLGFDPARGGFAHDAKEPLEADLVLVDEISMLDLVLAHHLVKAIQPPTRIAFVGDPDQLPSVSAGNVLADLLDSGAFPVYRLSRVFRQAAESRIVANAHRILAGEGLELPRRGDPPSDFYFFPKEDDVETADLLVDVVTRRVPERFSFDWVRDVQVLAPMYRGPCGVDALNERLRELATDGATELVVRGRTWRVGDRVIHTRNDYEKDVFNGDMGSVARIAGDGSGLTVRFPERELFYERDGLSDLQPAFAITVHRSQGGEFPAVVIPLLRSHYLMLQRNLLYTAVTRARRLVVLVGSHRALEQAIANATPGLRKSGLVDRLRVRPME